MNRDYFTLEDLGSRRFSEAYESLKEIEGAEINIKSEENLYEGLPLYSSFKKGLLLYPTFSE